MKTYNLSYQAPLATTLGNATFCENGFDKFVVPGGKLFVDIPIDACFFDEYFITVTCDEHTRLHLYPAAYSVLPPDEFSCYRAQRKTMEAEELLPKIELLGDRDCMECARKTNELACEDTIAMMIRRSQLKQNKNGTYDISSIDGSPLKMRNVCEQAITFDPVDYTFLSNPSKWCSMRVPLGGLRKIEDTDRKIVGYISTFKLAKHFDDFSHDKSDAREKLAKYGDMSFLDK